ncbi:MAG: FmdB family zinc ribbon protein [Bryobacteraceae bacterium]
MPVYEYRCGQCGREFEIRASMAEYSQGLEAVCPSCGSKDVERLISVAAILGRGGNGSGGDSCVGGPQGCACGG